MQPINLFYQEPDADRWIKYDRFPRRMIRRIIRGKQRPGGIQMIAMQLMKGLDKLNVTYRFNDFKYAQKHPEELICIIGKPQLLFNRHWQNPILFGSGVFSHPIDCPDLFLKYPNVKKILVAGEWMRKMFEPYYGEHVVTWPVGIDTDKWNPGIKTEPQVDFLIYEKILWNDENKNDLIESIKNYLTANQLSYSLIKYGDYTYEELNNKLSQAKAVIFLCEHETQGLACQQIMATDTPIFAWDRNEFWQDPAYYPHKVNFKPVSSVPYWDDQCGMKFKNMTDFEYNLAGFLKKSEAKLFSPRQFIINNLSLEICAKKYVDIVQSLNL